MSEPTCPYCGTTFGTLGGVRGHITRKTDDDHKGVNGWDLDDDDLLGDGSASTPTDDSDGDRSTTADETGIDGADSVPSLSGGLGIPSTPERETAESSTDGEPACPECGGSRYFDPREAGVDGYRYGCADCSTDDEWVVWNE